MADVLQIFMILLVFCLMLGLGSTVRPQNIKDVIKNPKAPAIGFVSQFILMPFTAWAMAKALGVPDTHGLSMILIGCTPGGSTSNLFTYFSRGDLPLSIAMTVVSNTAAFFMMPLLLLILGPSFTSDDVEIPYASIFVGLLVVLIPVGLGMVVLQKNEGVAKKLEKFASALGTIFIAAAIVAGIVQNPHLFTSGWKLYFSAILMLPCAAGFGYGIATLAGLPNKQRRTIFLETGIQNTTLTIAIITLAYPAGKEGSPTKEAEDDLQKDVLAFALMYSLFLIISSCIATFVFRKLSEGEVEEEEGEKKEGEAKGEVGAIDNNDI